jgi:type IV pilus assembly protein PilQ
MKKRINKVIKAGAVVWTVCVLVVSCLVMPALGQDSASASFRTDMAVVKDVTFTRQSKDELVVVTADRPLVYSYYRLNNPLRAVVDLAQTDPGTYTEPLVYQGGQVKQVRFVKHELASGLLTRMELFLAEGTDFSVKVAPGDKKKLILTFAADMKSPAFATSTTSALVEKHPIPKPSGTPSVTTLPPAAAPKSAPVADLQKNVSPVVVSPSPAPSGAITRKLTEIVVTPEGVDIITNAPIKTFNAFPMSKPDRMVVDLPGIRNGISAGKVKIGAFGIDSARIGEHEGKSRIVFEGANDSILKAKLVKMDKGLRLLPAAPTTATAKPEEKAAPVPALSKKQLDGTAGAVESLDFGVVDAGSRITMKVTGSCVAEKPFKNDEGLTFSVNKCSLPRALQRTIDTSAFPSAVQAVIPYQVSVKGVPEARVLVKLNQDATWTLRQDDGTVVLDITHPKLERKAVAAPAPQQDKAPADAATPATPASSGQAPAAVTSQPQPQPQSQAQLQAPPQISIQPATPPAPAAAAISDVAAKKLQESAAAPPGAKKVYTGRRVTLEFVDADIRKIFQLIAEVSNLNILIGDDVSGTITIKLINVPWDQALDMILETKGLGMKADGNIVQIKPKGKFKTADEEIIEAKKTRDKMMEMQTRVFDVNYAQISDVVSQFKALSSGRGDSSITPDERTNKVIVTDIEPAIIRMKKFLESIDIPEKQVLIEARIVEATAGFTRDLGIQWGIHYRDPTGSFMGIQALNSGFGGAVTPPPLIGSAGPGMATGISFGTLASNISVDLRLSAAATADLIKIISTPKIATVNNKPAKITQGQSIPYQNTTAQTGAVTQFVEAALTLEVTPRITPDGSVMMKIKASNNSPGATPAGGGPPPINKKEATTELLVKSGETTVIGGIYIDNDTESNSGVPFLMDIPFFGWLFKSNSKSKLKTELLIFITPRILG